MRAFVSAVAAVFLVACSDAATAPDHSGTYALISINGQAPPILVDEDEGGRVEITRGEIILRNDNTFDDMIEVTETLGESVNSEEFIEQGTWELDGRTFTMTYDFDGGTIDGELVNGRITQQLGALRFIYEKQ